jgi:ABC-type transport system involved in multi-copper enzyme maturation permease subunit
MHLTALALAANAHSATARNETQLRPCGDAAQSGLRWHGIGQQTHSEAAMFALPIIERELRVRARKPWTAWMRVIVALFVSLIAVSTLNWAQLRGWGGAWQPGKTLFDTLSVLVFLLCLVEGVRQTADCLSQEKRDGTLGLLFLTDLRGFDVVLGKLAATSLGSFYLLLAVFPAMAIALPAGGLTAGEFWRTQLVLLNSLFLAVAAGMWASARHREENRALTAGLSLMFAVTAGPWIFEGLLRGFSLPNISPWVALTLADDADYRADAARFWLTLAATHALAWALLAYAGRRVESGWRDESAVVVTAQSAAAPLALHPIILARARRLALSANPAAWLANRLPTHLGLIWISMLLLALGFASTRSAYLFLWGTRALGLSTAIQWGSTIIPLLLLTFVAARSFAEARREGTMELLLSTPLSPKAIVDGHWRALWRQVSVPFWLLVAIGLLIFVVGILSTSRFARVGIAPYVLVHLLGFANLLLRVLAVCWLSLFLGLRMKSTTQAIGYSLLWTLAVPALGTYIPQLLLTLARPLTLSNLGVQYWHWFALLVPSAFNVAYLVGVAVWARRRLLARFRELAADR